MLCYKVKGNKISVLPPPLSLLCLVSLTLIVCLPRSGNVTYVKKKMNEAPNTDLSFESERVFEYSNNSGQPYFLLMLLRCNKHQKILFELDNKNLTSNVEYTQQTLKYNNLSPYCVKARHGR